MEGEKKRKSMDTLTFAKKIMSLQRTPGTIEIRMLKRERWLTEEDKFRVKVYYASDDESLKKAIKRAGYYNRRHKYEVYYGLNLRKEDLGMRASRKSNVIDRPVLFFADIDIFHKETLANPSAFENILLSNKKLARDIKEEVKKWTGKLRNALERAQLPPLAIVYSGWGIQVIFLSPKPVPKQEYEYYEAGVVHIVNDVLKEVKFQPSPRLPPLLKKSSVTLQADEIYNVDRILRLPGFRNWRYPVYNFSEVFYPLEFKDVKPVNFRAVEEAAKLAEQERASKRKYDVVVRDGNEEKLLRGYTKYAWKGVIKMSDALIHEVANILSKYWIEGQRHNLALVAAGYFRAFGYTPDSVEEVFRKVCLLTNDDEVDDRLKTIEDTFSKPPVEGTIKYSVGRFLRNSILSLKIRSNKKKRLLDELEADMKKLKNLVWQDVKTARKDGRLTRDVKNGKVVNKL